MKSWLADKSKVVILIITMALLLLGSFGLGVYFFTSFFVDIINTESVRMENGEIITMERGGTFHIYLEDNRPPIHTNHGFTFTNTVTGQIVYSRPMPANFSVIYNIGNVHGRRIALAELEQGDHILEFAPWQGTGYFTQGVEFIQPAFMLFMQMGLIGLAIMVFFIFITLLSVRLYKLSKLQQRQLNF
ncbi:MAG: hypothetical protein FWE21_00805 [Defluviitaleaceae bacterium]|nr:hypothetical protein [Defluviitaleaceae bacterium]